MRIVMMGTGGFAVPTFRSLLDSVHTISALVTRPPKAMRGKNREATSPMREVAEQSQLPVLMPEDINAEQARTEIASLQADLFIVCDYGQILSHDLLNAAGKGGVNLHASLLPRYRGAAPINWAIYDGQSETGVTVIHMTSKLDAGPCLTTRGVMIGPDESAVELEKRLAEVGVDAVHEAIGMLADWDGQSALGKLQDSTTATKAPRLKKSDGEVEWKRTAAQIRNQVLAMKPWPGTFCHWLRKGHEPFRLILERVEVVDHEDHEQNPPGTVLSANGRQIVVATGGGCLRLDAVQPAGKKLLSAAEFLRGYHIAPGDRMQVK
jgi:methionyl-tRNA formyltransferase